MQEASEKVSADMENDIKTAQNQATVERTKTMIPAEKLTAQPQEVAEDIYKAQQKGKNVLYTK